MIKIKNIHAPAEKSDGKRILITRFRPKTKDGKSEIPFRSMRIDLWMVELSPTPQIYSAYRRDKNREKFNGDLYRYLHDPLRVEKTQHCLRTLKMMEFFGGNVTLITFPQDAHGDLIRKLIMGTPQGETIRIEKT